MAFTVRYSEWSNQFQRNSYIEVNAQEEVVQEACQVLFERIIDRTPVGDPGLWNPPVWPKGYTPGTLKGAWKIRRVLDVYEISNNTPYAERVETGWSTQAPEGMMRISVLEFHTILAEVENKRGN